MADFGFLYDAIDAASLNSRRNFLALCGTTLQSKVALFDLTSGAGAQAVTGVGFMPECIAIIGIGMRPPETHENGACIHVGWATASGEWGGSIFGEYIDFNWSAVRHGYWRDDHVIAVKGGPGDLGADVPDMLATLASFDADGFTLNKDLPPTHDVRMMYLALRGGGGYKVGTATTPLVSGIQTISGLGLLPKAVYIANGQGPLLQTLDQYIGIGAGDFADQFCVWSGARKGSAFRSHRNDTGDIVTFAEAASGSAGAGRAVLSQASLSARTSDSFSLNWHTVDGVARNFHWIAFGGDADVDRFLYDPLANDKEVPCLCQPKALVGFGNDQTVEDWDDNFRANGLGLSCCNDDGTEEWTFSYREGHPVGLNITASNKRMKPGSFGCLPGQGGGLTQAARNHCNIIQIFGEPAQIGMNWRYAQRHGVATRALSGDQ